MLFEIYFVSDDHYSNVGTCFLIELFNPGLALFKTVSARDIKNDASTDCVLVVHLRKTFVSLLPSSIPHFILDDVLTDIFILGQEAAANSGLMRVRELSVCIPIVRLG